VEAGTVVGYMAVRSGNSVLASVPVVTARGAEANPFLALIDSMKAFVTGRVFIAFVVCAVALTVLFFVALAIFTELSRKKRRRNYRVTRFR
jgi:ABC-type polysaccharide/polyol phosphate export permease